MLWDENHELNDRYQQMIRNYRQDKSDIKGQVKNVYDTANKLHAHLNVRNKKGFWRNEEHTKEGRELCNNLFKIHKELVKLTSKIK